MAQKSAAIDPSNTALIESQDNLRALTTTTDFVPFPPDVRCPGAVIIGVDLLVRVRCSHCSVYRLFLRCFVLDLVILSFDRCVLCACEYAFGFLRRWCA
jgi:hypothetical protein